MLILPTRGRSDGVKVALELLDQIANQRMQVSIIVFDDGDRPREIASRADVRADGHPGRRVVWIPDMSVLDAVSRYAFLLKARTAGAEAVALTLDFVLSSHLSGPTATKFTRLETAFAAALAGTVMP
jgi:hypothetical protein